MWRSHCENVYLPSKTLAAQVYETPALAITYIQCDDRNCKGGYGLTSGVLTFRNSAFHSGAKFGAIGLCSLGKRLYC
jgi:hypothetical protein